MQTNGTSRIFAATQEGSTLLRIGEVAALTGLTPRTIRYYEELGLLSPLTRTEGDYRLYSRGDVARLEEIARLKDLLGFSLAEIKQIVEGEEARNQLRMEYHATTDIGTRLSRLAEAVTVTQGQLALLDRKMSRMGELRSELAARLARYEQKKVELESMGRGEAIE